MGINQKDFPPLPSQAKKSQRRKSDKLRRSGGHSASSKKVITIDNLPNELILKILDFLQGIDMEDFQLLSLASLSLTSRRLHQLVAERLFLSYDSRFCESYLFLRTVSSAPYLAELVRHVYMFYGGPPHPNNRYIASAQDKKMIKEGMRRLRIPNWKAWATDCNANDYTIDNLLSAILMHTPNVSTLEIQHHGSFQSQRPRWLDILKKSITDVPFGHTHQFERLRTIHVRARSFNLEHLSILWRMHALRKLHLDDLVAVECVEEPITSTMRHLIPKACNNLEELVLDSCFLHMDILRSMSSLFTNHTYCH